MTLLEIAAETATDLPPPPDTTDWPWWGVLILAVATIAATVFGWTRGKAIGAKAAAKAVAPSMLIAAGLLACAALSGCAAGIQKEAARPAIDRLEWVVHDLEDRANAAESERKANQKQIDTLKEAVK